MHRLFLTLQINIATTVGEDMVHWLHKLEYSAHREAQSKKRKREEKREKEENIDIPIVIPMNPSLPSSIRHHYMIRMPSGYCFLANPFHNILPTKPAVKATPLTIATPSSPSEIISIVSSPTALDWTGTSTFSNFIIDQSAQAERLRIRRFILEQDLIILPRVCIVSQPVVAQCQVVEAFAAALGIVAEDLGQQAHTQLLLRAAVGLDQAPCIVELCLHARKRAILLVLLSQDC